MSATTGTIPLQTARAVTAPWLRVAAALFAVAWGGNEFTPLLVVYRQQEHLGAVTVNILLGAYVLGIVPALLLGGPLSDRYGRRPLMLPAPILALAGSVALGAAHGSVALLFAGRVLSGLALGLVMAVGTAWIKELSDPPFDRTAAAGSGAGRAALSLTAGFGLGGAVAAALAQFGPAPEVLPYAVNAVLCTVSFLLLRTAPESRRRPAQSKRLVDDLKVPAAAHRRFLLVVAPMAPWVFGTAASAYAILPVLLAGQVPGDEVAFAGIMTVACLGSGLAAQMLFRRFDRVGSLRGVASGMIATVPSMLLAAATVVTRSVTIALVASAALGVAYGILLVAGLSEVQQIARADDLAGLTAVYYSISYIGFFIPALLAALAPVLGYPVLFMGGSAVAAGGLVFAFWAHRRHPVN